MPEQMRPASPEQAPDPSDTYERAHPEHESGQGQLDANAKATPTPAEDKMPTTVTHAQDGTKQINAQEAATRPDKAETPAKINEPMGWESDKKK